MRQPWLRWLFVGDVPDEAETLAGHGADQPLRLAAVAHRLARGVDPAGQGRFRDDPPAPNRVQQIVLGDNAVAVADQVHQQVEHLRLQRDRFAAPPQFAARHVEHVVGKAKLHLGPLRPISRNNHTFLKAKSSASASLSPPGIGRQCRGKHSGMQWMRGLVLADSPTATILRDGGQILVGPSTYVEGRTLAMRINTIDPAKTAIIVVDMQNDFVAAGAPMETPAARAMVPKLSKPWKFAAVPESA